MISDVTMSPADTGSQRWATGMVTDSGTYGTVTADRARRSMVTDTGSHRAVADTGSQRAVTDTGSHRAVSKLRFPPDAALPRARHSMRR